MAAVVNALSHNGRKHGQNDQANDNCSGESFFTRHAI